jgi:hypothetical protein
MKKKKRKNFYTEVFVTCRFVFIPTGDLFCLKSFVSVLFYRYDQNIFYLHHLVLNWIG